MEWKEGIKKQLIQASNQRKINITLKNLVKLLLVGSTRFNLVYSGTRAEYISIKFREELTKDTSKILLTNGYKSFYLNNK